MKPFLILTTALFVLAALSGCAQKESGVPIDRAMLAAFKPLPEIIESANNPVTPEKVELGRMLFYEKRLSKSYEFSCNSCHGLNTFGVDNESVSSHQKGKLSHPCMIKSQEQIAVFDLQL